MAQLISIQTHGSQEPVLVDNEGNAEFSCAHRKTKMYLGTLFCSFAI
jgi:hypothetical protein